MKAIHVSGNTCPHTQRILCQILHKALLAVALLVLGSGVLIAADFQVGSGDSFELGAGTLDLECGNLSLQSGAVFNAGSGNIQLSGNWNNQGTFNRGSSSVTFNDACGPGTLSTVTGETYFNNLTASTIAAHELQLESDLTQSIANALVLKGADGGLLKIRSSIPHNAAFFMLEFEGSQNISYVDVQDNFAIDSGQWLAPAEPAFFNSVDNGGNRRWFLIGTMVEPIHALSRWGLACMVLLLSAVYLRQTGRNIHLERDQL